MATAVMSSPSNRQNPPRRRKQDSFGNAPANRAAVGEFRDGIFVSTDASLAGNSNASPKKMSHKSKSRSSPTVSAMREGGSLAATPSKSQAPVSTTPKNASPPKSPPNHYAGGAYANSPDPSALPMPVFANPRKSMVTPVAGPFVVAPPSSTIDASNNLRKLLNIPQAVSAQ